MRIFNDQFEFYGIFRNVRGHWFRHPLHKGLLLPHLLLRLSLVEPSLILFGQRIWFLAIVSLRSCA